MKILAIGAHPDDIEIFMYGFLSACKFKGDDIFLVVATDGSLGGEKNIDLVNKRSEETKKALKEIADPVSLNLPDGSLGNEISHLQIIKECIIGISPDLIITHYSKDYHSDHRSLSKIVKKIAGHYIPILFCDTMMGLRFDPDYYVDITKYFDKKINAVLCHKTQKPKRFVDLIKLTNSFRAAQCNSPIGTFAEAYKFNKSFPFTDIRDLLPKAPKLRSFEITSENGFL